MRAKSQWDFGELFPTETMRTARRTPTGCRPPALGLARNPGVPCRGTRMRRVSSRLRRPFRAGDLLGPGSQGSAARNPGLYSVAPLGQGSGPTARAARWWRTGGALEGSRWEACDRRRAHRFAGRAESAPAGRMNVPASSVSSAPLGRRASARVSGGCSAPVGRAFPPATFSCPSGAEPSCRARTSSPFCFAPHALPAPHFILSRKGFFQRRGCEGRRDGAETEERCPSLRLSAVSAHFALKRVVRPLWLGFRPAGLFRG